MTSPGNGAPFDREVDALVVGSGSGGFVAALAAKARGLETLLIEKSSVYGGSSAYSGGGAWIPNHPVLVRQGQRDDPQKILDYLLAIAGDKVPRARLERYVEQAPKMAQFLETQSQHLNDAFTWTKGYSDYHPDKGGNPEGRGLWPKPIDLRLLGDDVENLRRPAVVRGGPLPPGAWMTSQDFWDVIRLKWKGGAPTSLKAMARLGARIARYRLLGERMATSGQALMARLRLAGRERNVELWLSTPLRSLITDDRGRVIGAEVERDGKPLRIRARHGVLLATGGFDHNPEMRAQYHAEVDHTWSFGSPDNTGDGQRIGQELGAAVDLMDDAWWMPGMKLKGAYWPMLSERQAPGQFIVNKAGKRFVSEAAPYTDFGHAQIEGHRTGVSHIPAYQITDSTALNRNFIAGKPPWKAIPAAWWESGFVHQASTIEELAGKIGVSPDALRETQQRFNEFARRGVDEDFHRGESAYENYYADPSYPNPNLAAVDTPPYVAFEVVPGDLGTKGGLVTNENAQVLRTDGSVIEGLYATGNASASVMGNDYAGPGATIGPSMTFGYVAALHMAGELQPEPIAAESASLPAG
jgi:succinate dehydrogenase/fumarate reductase flavoprotein subunit